MAVTTEDNVKALLAEYSGKPVTVISYDTRLIEDLGADSLDVIEFAMAIEEEFSLDIPDHDIERWRTVKDVIDYIKAERMKRDAN